MSRFERKIKQACIPTELVKTEKCDIGWKFSHIKAGQGCTGTVVTACCGKNCNFVAKFIPLKPDPPAFPFPPKRFNNEVEILKKCNESENSPCVKLIDSWRSKVDGMIIMKPLRITLLSFLLEKLNKNKFSDVSLDVRLTIIRAIIDCFYTMKRLHNINILHNDLHTSNLMANYTNVLNGENDYKNYKDSNYKWYIIDMGKSKLLTSDEKEIHKLQMEDFDLLKGSIVYDVEMELGPGIFDGIVNNGELEVVNLLDPLFVTLAEMLATHKKEDIWDELKESTTYFQEVMI